MSFMPRLASQWVRQVTWICCWGPLLSLLPERWRGNRLGQRMGDWQLSAELSGVFELSLALELFWGWFGERLHHPVFLWLALYLAVDGPWRALSAHTAGQAPGTLLLAVLEEAAQAWFRSRGWRGAPLLDVVTLDEARADWQLRIESCRDKRDWEPGRIVRWEQTSQGGNVQRYFRLESAIHTAGLRPFVYLLRSLPAGVAGPTVLTYSAARAASSK
jgi:hypothetical protein